MNLTSYAKRTAKDPKKKRIASLVITEAGTSPAGPTFTVVCCHGGVRGDAYDGVSGAVVLNIVKAFADEAAKAVR